MSDPRRPVWFPSDALRRHANLTVSGDPEIDWPAHVRRRHFPVPPRRVLVVGCGDGHLEVVLARHWPAAEIAGVDADAAAVDRASQRAARRDLSRVRHAPLDLRRGALPDGEWDAVFVQNLLHRVGSPERLLRGVHDALAPTGRVVLSEFVGGSDEALPEAVRRYRRLLPVGLRFEPATGLPLPRAADSSPRAGEPPDALALARTIFVEEGLHRGGGGLLQPLLAGLEPLGAPDERVLEVLIAAERDLHARGLVADAFAIFVGRRRAAATG